MRSMNTNTEQFKKLYESQYSFIQTNPAILNQGPLGIMIRGGSKWLDYCY